MTTQDIFTAILKSTYTKSDFSHRVEILRTYLEIYMYSPEEKITLSSFLKNNIVNEQDSAVLTSIGDKFLNFQSRESAHDLIMDLKIGLGNLPILTVYLPFKPEFAEIAKLGIWCRENIDANLLIDLRLERHVMGGCALVWKGVYRDYSLHYYIEKNRDKILGLVSSQPNPTKS